MAKKLTLESGSAAIEKEFQKKVKTLGREGAEQWKAKAMDELKKKVSEQDKQKAASTPKTTAKTTAKKETKPKKTESLMEHTAKVGANIQGQQAVDTVKSLEKSAGPATNKKGQKVDVAKGVQNQVNANTAATQAYDAGTLVPKNKVKDSKKSLDSLQKKANEISDEGKTTEDYTPPTREEAEKQGVEAVLNPDEEEAPEIPATLEDSLNTAENSESVRNQLDKYGVHDPSNQGEMEQAAVEAQQDATENIGEGTATAGNAKNKEEFDSILEQNKKEIEAATKVSGWFNVASVLEVLSLVACVFTGGAVPFVPFTRFGGIQSYVDNNAKLQARASAIQGQTDALTEQNRALRQEETKYKSALANEEARKQLKERIKSEHPDWTDEQIESDVNRILKQQAETSEDIQKEKVMSQIRLDEKDHTTPDEIMNYIRQLNQEKIQIDNAIKAVQSDDIDKAAQLYGSLIGTFSVLSSSTVNNTSGHTFGAGVGGETGGIANLIAKANGNINYGYNTGSQAGATNLSREGVQVADALKAEYKNNTKAVKQQMIADLEEAKREIDQHIAEYKQSYKNQTGRNLDESDEDKKNVVSTGDTSNVGSPEGMKSSSNGGGLLKAAIGLISDCRKKHTYVPKDKRSTMVKSDQLAKHTYIPSNKRSTQEGIGNYNGVAVNWKKNKEAENNGTENTEAVQKEE